MADVDLLIQEIPSTDGKVIAKITLNAERRLNSIDLPMIEALYDALKSWQINESVVCVWLEGAGEKAFCAGGDVRRLYQSMIEHPNGKNSYAESFFTTEYQLDYFIHTYPKPIICWGHGIVMGGGLGLMAGCQHRIVTEKTRLAMPEITIGLYPDVGATWFLNRMPMRLGRFVALTGASLNALDAIYLGLADQFIAADKKEDVFAALVDLSWSDDTQEHNNQLHQCLKKLAVSREDYAIESPIKFNEDILVDCVNYACLADIYQAIRELPTENNWINKAKTALINGSPTTAHLIFRQLEKGKHLSLKEAFMLELILSIQCTRHIDFREGVRALLIDKDMQPNWQYSSIDVVPTSWIDEHFESPWLIHPLEKM